MSDLIEIEQAIRLVLELALQLPPEDVLTDVALGRVLAREMHSADPVPRFDNSAMDGFAVRAADTAGASREDPVKLRLGDESRAGDPAAASLSQGGAIAISTGAMVPAGADAVVRFEETRGRDDTVEVLAEVDEGSNIRRTGDDIRAGERVLEAGTRIGPAELGVAASTGAKTLACTRRPRVRVVVSGDELVIDPDEPLLPGQIRDANAHTLAALAGRAGAEVVGVERVSDDLRATREAISKALEGDLVLISGGVSVGEHDHVKQALGELNISQVFWGIALKPGKPTWFGVDSDGTLVFGLPGNPVSAFVCFLLLARPAIGALLGARRSMNRTTAVLDQTYEKRPGRTHAVRCGLRLEADGWHVTPTKEQASHILTSMLGADALAMIPADSGSVTAGTRVDIELLGVC